MAYAGRPGRGQTLTQAYVNVESMDLLAPGITLGRRFTRLLRHALSLCLQLVITLTAE